VSGLGYHARTLTIASPGRGTTDITAEVQRVVAEAGVHSGLCNVFIHHTSASLIVCENADPSVRSDLERFAARLVPDGDAMFEHRAEGPDDMPAHVRSVLTQTSLSLPVSGGRCDLGTWQGVYLWEHRHGGHRRKITISVIGT
jgi:secondary thiamine-phosphate synthase enzyme